MRIELGYPDRTAERNLLKGKERRELLESITPAMSPEDVISIQTAVPRVHVSDALLDYIQDVVEHTRQDPAFGTGLSPRGSLAILRSAQAMAYIEDRDHVLPEDIQHILGPVIGHRIRSGLTDQKHGIDETVQKLIQTIPIP